MTDGFGLDGGGPVAKRRGRPPGSRNKRAVDLVGWVEAKSGGTAALQLAKGCMVTLAEVKAAGSLERAELAKARRKVEAFDVEAARLDRDLQGVVRAVLAELLERAERTAKADVVLSLVAPAVEAMQAGGGRLTLLGALDRMGEDRRALLPYTDQKQAQRVDLKAEGFAPVMILDTGSRQPEKVEQYQGALIDVTPQGSRPKAHEEDEA